MSDRADPVRQLTADWRVRTDLYLRLVTVADTSFDAHWGHTPDNPAEPRRGTVLCRAPGKTVRFASVLELHEQTPSVAGVAFAEDGRVLVQRYDGGELAYGR